MVLQCWSARWLQLLISLVFIARCESVASAQQCRRPQFWETGCCVYNQCPLNGEVSHCAEIRPGCALLGDMPDTNVADIKRPACPSSEHTMQRVVGYYEGSAARRQCHNLTPFEIPRGVYTHLNYAFATIDPKTFEVLLAHKQDYILYRDIVALKHLDGNLKVYLSVGGWYHNSLDEDAETSVMAAFSKLAGSSKSQKVFFRSLTSIMHTFGFDGVDIHWPYPGQVDRGGQREDAANFPKLIENLKQHLDKKSPQRNGLSVAVPLRKDALPYFDMPKLQQSVDFFNMLSYTSEVEEGGGRRNLILQPHANLTDAKSALATLWEQNINPSKVVFGLSSKVKEARIENKDCRAPGCPSKGPGPPGRCSDTVGVLLPQEAHGLVPSSGSSETVQFDREAGVKYYSSSTAWVSYEDQETWQFKTDFARSQCLGGIAIWPIVNDHDGYGISSQIQSLTGYRSDHPLMHENKEALQDLRENSPAQDLGNSVYPYLGGENAANDAFGLCGSYRQRQKKLSLAQTILCEPYPERRHRKASSDPDQPQVPGGYLSPYGLKRISHPKGSSLASGTTERCGRWHIAADGETCKTLLQVSGADLSLLADANPSLDRASCVNMLEVGAAYCVAPMQGFELPYRDIGCYYNINREVMPTMEYFMRIDPGMTVDKCAKFCMMDFSMDYFGVKNGKVCMCGYGVHFDTTKVKDKYCNKPCGGNVAMKCGGKKYTRLYSRSEQLSVVSSPDSEKPDFGNSFGRVRGCGSGGMKNAWGGPRS